MRDGYDDTEDVIDTTLSQRPRATSTRSLGRAVVDTGRDGYSVSRHSGLPLLRCDGVPVVPEHPDRLPERLRRPLIDLPLALAALLVLLPLLLGVALAVRFTSKGPVLFSQWRVGQHGRPFRMLKFRTLRAEACDLAGHRQVAEDDERVTPIGRFLRSTSLDELPQLWNVLVGEMALVGPRPMVHGMRAGGADYRALVPYYSYRQLVRPGITGWAQANGLRGPTDDAVSARQRIDHDCAYIQNASLGLDARIIVRTLRREFLSGSGI